MSSSDWEEIKRLAADFQRAQLSSSLQRLSESNCIEIIGKLIELRLLDIHHTSDGKEYITPAQLDREIVDELFVSGGRLNLTQLCKILFIDLDLVQKRAAHIVNNDRRLNLVLGQLISENYLDLIAEEINEKLQQDGSIAIGDVAQQYDLPGEFVFQAVVKRLGSIVFGIQDTGDPQTIFTEAFIERHEAQVRGVLSAITRPTSVAKLLAMFNFQEKLFFNVAEKLVSSKQIAGKLSAGRQATNSIYMPDIYSQAQYDWVNNFFNQNGYLDYDSLSRLDISDAESYIKRNLPKCELWFVDGACIGELFMGQIEANIEDTIATGGLVDIAPFLPSQFSPEVCLELITLCMERVHDPSGDKRSQKSGPKCHIFNETFILSDTLLTKARVKLEESMETRAQEEINKGAFKQQLSRSKLADADVKNKKDDRKKKAVGGKQGGGTQGRETKTKSTKNKHKGRRAQHDSDSDDEASSQQGASGRGAHLEFLSLEQLQKKLSKDSDFEDAPEEVLEEVASYLSEPLNRKFNEVARETYTKIMQGGGGSRKQNYKQMQEKLISLVTTVKLAEKTLKNFESETELHTQLSKFLLKTHCTEILNNIITYLAHDAQIDIVDGVEMTSETRLKIVRQLEDEFKEPLTATHKALALASVDDFLTSLEPTMSTADILWKRKDSKKDKQFLQQHRMCLLEQLSASIDPALTLHLTVLLVYISATGSLLHASGKFVPQILSSLRTSLPLESYILLAEYQGLVMQSLTLKSDDPELGESRQRLEELSPKVKEFGVTFKKGKSQEAKEDEKD